jgi:hypothetical protein
MQEGLGIEANLKSLTNQRTKCNLPYVNRAVHKKCAGGRLFGGAQTSKSAVSRVSKPNATSFWE